MNYKAVWTSHNVPAVYNVLATRIGKRKGMIKMDLRLCIRRSDDGFNLITD